MFFRIYFFKEDYFSVNKQVLDLKYYSWRLKLNGPFNTLEWISHAHTIGEREGIGTCLFGFICNPILSYGENVTQNVVLGIDSAFT